MEAVRMTPSEEVVYKAWLKGNRDPRAIAELVKAQKPATLEDYAARAKRISEKHPDATITIEAEGSKTTFTVHIPNTWRVQSPESLHKYRLELQAHLDRLENEHPEFEVGSEKYYEFWAIRRMLYDTEQALKQLPAAEMIEYMKQPDAELVEIDTKIFWRHPKTGQFEEMDCMQKSIYRSVVQADVDAIPQQIEQEREPSRVS